MDGFDPRSASSRVQHGSLPAPRKVLSMQDWENKKNIIRYLYITKDLSLEQVVACMTREHSFKASARMYKSRLDKWGFHKNVGQRDWQAAAVMWHLRWAEQKETVAFEVHGRTKTLRELEQYIARCHMSIQEYVAKALAEGVTASAAIRCVSPVNPDSGVPKPASGSGSGTQSSSSGIISGAPKWTPNSSSGSRGSHRQQHRVRPLAEHRQAPVENHHNHTSVSAVPVLAAAMPNLMQDSSSKRYMNGIEGAIDHNEEHMDCDYIQQELGIMSALTYRPDAVGAAFPDIRDSDGWELVSKPDANAEPKICPKCQFPCRGHSPLPRTLFQSSPVEFGQLLHYQPLPPEVMPMPGSEKAAKFQAYCYATCMFGSQEKYELLSKCLQQADQIFEEMLRENNPMVLLSVLLALTVLHAHDRGAIAASIIRSTYNVSASVLGKHNPITLNIEWLTAAACQKSTDCWINANGLREIRLAMLETFGEEHPHTTVASYCLAFRLIKDKAFAEAETILARLVGICQTTLGKSNLQTVSTLNTLGRARKRQGKYDEAIATLREALDLRPLGPNHAYQLDSLKELAKLYKITGRENLIEPIYWAVFKGRIKTLGRLHSFTESAKLDLERFLKNSGRWDEQGVMEAKVERLFRNGPLTSDVESF